MIIINRIITNNILRYLNYTSEFKKRYVRIYSIYTYLLIFIPIFFIQFLLNLIMFIPFAKSQKNFLFYKIFTQDNILSYINYQYVKKIEITLNIIISLNYIFIYPKIYRDAPIHRFLICTEIILFLPFVLLVFSMQYYVIIYLYYFALKE